MMMNWKSAIGERDSVDLIHLKLTDILRLNHEVCSESQGLASDVRTISALVGRKLNPDELRI